MSSSIAIGGESPDYPLKSVDHQRNSSQDDEHTESPHFALDSAAFIWVNSLPQLTPQPNKETKAHSASGIIECRWGNTAGAGAPLV